MDRGVIVIAGPSQRRFCVRRHRRMWEFHLSKMTRLRLRPKPAAPGTPVVRMEKAAQAPAIASRLRACFECVRGKFSLTPRAVYKERDHHPCVSFAHALAIFLATASVSSVVLVTRRTARAPRLNALICRLKPGVRLAPTCRARDRSQTLLVGIVSAIARFPLTLPAERIIIRNGNPRAENRERRDRRRSQNDFLSIHRSQSPKVNLSGSSVLPAFSARQETKV